MGIKLTVQLTDTEAAHLLEVAAIAAPGASAKEVKAWAEDLMKDALRAEVQRHARAERREAENTARKVADADLDTAWAKRAKGRADDASLTRES